MEITPFFMENNMLSTAFILATLIFIFLFIIKLTKFKNLKNLPPGPPKLPIIGNLHQVGDKPHVSLAHFAKEHGPLISLRLGTQVLVVASSPEAAMGVLKTQDRLLSSRTVPTAFQQESLLPHSILWSDCNESWKTLRTLCQTEMFSAKALQAHSRLRQEKLDRMVDFLHKKQGQAINVEKVIFATLFNSLSCVVFGKDLVDLESEHEVMGGLKDSLFRILAYGGQVKDFEDRRAQVNSSTWSSDQAKSFVDRLLEKKFTNNQINEYVAELFVAGGNTTTTALVWAMSELVRNKDIISKIQEEIKREVKSEKLNESHLSKLPYLQACIKETLRLHPPVPFLLPHKAKETCEVMNYTIPKNARIFVNVWAMGQDPKVWDDPLSFKPERFLGSNLDYKGQHFELLPFGSGRRICPGLPLGSKNMELILATLIHEFDWALPNGQDPMKLNMDHKFVITLKKEQPLELVFKPKQASSVA
ncbi:hypothetical protein OSB04_017270 [Centaurea solstitialis]|uniref:Cytochrome P450 n=1 Tax=Centaurea solstitialis TaxID=347529 RepID=A0AA38TEH3_9ASTR|nr:hypothetical protein OSB04_017270 [Centaurea solstitialis]